MRTWRVRFTAPAVAVVAAAVFAVWVTLSIGGSTATRNFDDVGTLAAASAGAITCMLAARCNDGRSRLFWLLLGVASALWAFGEGAWGFYDIVLGREVPVPSYADIGYLGAIPVALAALLVHPGHSGDRQRRLRTGLDALILATALLFLSSTFILHAVGADTDLHSAAGLVAIAYPLGDVLMLFLLLRAVGWLGGADRLAMACILTGLLAMTLSDSGYTYLTAARGYETGSWIDTGWIVGYLGLALGGWYGRQPAAVADRVPSASTTTVTMVLPYLLPLTSLAVLTVRAQLGQHVDRFSLALAFVLTGSVLIRQVLVGFANPEPA
jgi:hypothetical protein